MISAGFNWKGALAGALSGAGQSYLGRRKEDREHDMAKELAAAKGGGAQSGLGKIGFDLFGRMPQTPEEWAQVSEMKKGSSWGPQGEQPLNPGEIAATIQAVMQALEGKPKQPPVPPAPQIGGPPGMGPPQGGSVIGTFKGGQFIPKFGNRGMM